MKCNCVEQNKRNSLRVKQCFIVVCCLNKLRGKQRTFMQETPFISRSVWGKRKCETIFFHELGLLLYLSVFLIVFYASAFPPVPVFLCTAKEFDGFGRFNVCTENLCRWQKIEVWITLLTFLSFHRFVTDFMFTMSFAALSLLFCTHIIVVSLYSRRALLCFSPLQFK